MLLNLLSCKEKETFLEMAVRLANSDLEFSTDEEALINQYREEMLLSENDYRIKDLSIEECLSLLLNSNRNVKNIIYFELLSLAMCDENLDKKEINILNLIKNSFAINDEKSLEMQKSISVLTESYKHIIALINE